MERERILIITRNFPPFTGGMERLVQHCYLELSKEFTCDVIGPAGCENFVDSADTAIGCRVRPLPLFLALTAHHAIRATGKHRYSLLLAGSGVTAPIAVHVARLRGTESASLVHGLDVVASNPLYQRCFVPSMQRADLLIANSCNTRRLAIDRGLDSDRIQVLNPGVELPTGPADTESFRTDHGLEGARLLLSVGRLIPRKGLAEFIDQAMPAIVRECSDCTLVIIGQAATDAVSRSADLGGQLSEAIARNGLQEHVLMLGRVDDGTLRAAYEASQVFVFPVVDVPGDVEGFGMVALEAAAHGVPTVAFDAGGVADAVANGHSGKLLASGDYDGMARAILNIIEDSDDWSAGCRSFAQSLAWPEYGRRLRDSVRRLLRK